MKSFFSGNGKKISGHLFWRIESTNLFRLHDNVPGPTEKALQTTSHTISSSNPSIIRSRPESIIFSLLPGSDNLPHLFSQL
jgi:hypothetical protein